MADVVNSSTACDLDALCRPISDDQPTGEPLDRRRSMEIAQLEYTLYGALTDWEEARIKGWWTQGEMPEPLEKLSWDELVDACSEIISNRCKDLPLAGILSVALAYRDGFTGVRDGLALIYRLVDHFRDRLHPQPMTKTLESLPPVFKRIEDASRVATWVDPQTSLRSIQGHNRLIDLNGERICQVRWKVCEYLAKPPNLTEEQLKKFRDASLSKGADFDSGGNQDAAGLSKADTSLLREACGANRPDFSQRVTDEIKEAIELCSALEVLLKEQAITIADEKTSERIRNSFSVLDALRKTLGSCLEEFRLLSGVVDEVDEPESGDPLEGTAAESDGASMPAGNEASTANQSGPFRSRQQALASLRQVRDFFLASEPHSPIPAILARAISWGDASLEEILRDLIGNQAEAVQALRDRANLKISSEATGEEDESSH